MHDGTMARMPRLIEFAKEHNLKIVTTADLIKYRLKHEPVERNRNSPMPSAFGNFQIKRLFMNSDEAREL